MNMILARLCPHVSLFKCCLQVITCKNSLSSPLPEIEIITLLVWSNHWASNTELLQRTVTLYIVSNILILFRLF